MITWGISTQAETSAHIADTLIAVTWRISPRAENSDYKENLSRGWKSEREWMGTLLQLNTINYMIRLGGMGSRLAYTGLELHPGYWGWNFPCNRNYLLLGCRPWARRVSGEECLSLNCLQAGSWKYESRNPW